MTLWFNRKHAFALWLSSANWWRHIYDSSPIMTTYWDACRSGECSLITARTLLIAVRVGQERGGMSSGRVMYVVRRAVRGGARRGRRGTRMRARCRPGASRDASVARRDARSIPGRAQTLMFEHCTIRKFHWKYKSQSLKNQDSLSVYFFNLQVLLISLIDYVRNTISARFLRHLIKKSWNISGHLVSCD